MDEIRKITFRPAFHRCHDQPHLDYGIGGVSMQWLLKLDGRGAIIWTLLTDWGLPDEAFKAANPDCSHPMHRDSYPLAGRPTPGAIEWHSRAPLAEGQRPLDLLRIEGDEAVWARLRVLLVAPL
jgi:hypothetical protein